MEHTIGLVYFAPEEVAVKKLILNQEVAKTLEITFPPDMVQGASQ